MPSSGSGAARDPPDDLSVEGELRVIRREVGALDRQHAEAAVRMPPVMEPRNRLLAGVAALREADRTLLEPRLGRHHAVVELATEPRRACPDAQPLELALADRLGADGRLGVDQLDRRDAVVAGGNELVSIQHELVPTEHTVEECTSTPISHFAANRVRSSSGARRSPASGSVSSRNSSSPGRQTIHRRHHPGLRRQQERLARLANGQGLDLVRDHPLFKYEAASGPITET